MGHGGRASIQWRRRYGHANAAQSDLPVGAANTAGMGSLARSGNAGAGGFCRGADRAVGTGGERRSPIPQGEMEGEEDLGAAIEFRAYVDAHQPILDPRCKTDPLVDMRSNLSVKKM